MQIKKSLKWFAICFILFAIALIVAALIIAKIPKLPEPDGPYLRYFTDKKIAEKGHYLNNQLHGQWQKYFASGRLKRQGQFVHGQQAGLWIDYFDRELNPISEVRLWHDDGGYSHKNYCYTGGLVELKHYTENHTKTGGFYEFYCLEGEQLPQDTKMEITTGQMQRIKEQANYVAGNLDGLYIFYHESGKVLSRGYFANGKLEGDWINYDYRNGITEKGGYQANSKVGVWRTYQNGILIAKDEYLTEQRIKHSAYYDNGNVSEQGVRAYVDYDSGFLPEGEWVFFHDNGQFKERGQYKEGLRQGGWTFFDLQGRLKTQGGFTKDQKEGVWLNFHDGIKHTVSNYNQNLLQGDYQEFHPNGDLFFQCTMLDDVCNGPYHIYFDNKQISEQGEFKRGYKEGAVTQYYDSGQVKMKTSYRHGHFIGDFVHYYENGILQSQGRFVSDIGHVTDGYGSNSTIEIVGAQRDGDWSYYYDNGQLRRKGKFNQNERIGLWYYYDRQGHQTELRLYQNDMRFFRMEDETTSISQFPELDIKDEDYFL